MCSGGHNLEIREYYFIMSRLTHEQEGSELLLCSLKNHHAVFSVPETNYSIHANVSEDTPPLENGRVRGYFIGEALRLHPARGGGLFIEPMVGEPRIVAGRLSILEERIAVIKSVIIFCLKIEKTQIVEDLVVGNFVNGYVHSGITFCSTS